jgi:glucose-1-phosphate adenylyltransferase
MKEALGIITANYSAHNPGELTKARPLASLPYAGRFRLVDFPLSNMSNAGIHTVGVIMPTNYRSLIDHIGSGKPWLLDRKGGGLFILPGSAFGTSRTGSRFLLRDLEYNRIILDRATEDYVILSASNIVMNFDLHLLMDAYEEAGSDVMVLTATAQGDNEDLIGFDVEGDNVRALHHGVHYGSTAFLDCFVIRRDLLIDMLGWYEQVDYLDLFEAMESDFGRIDVRVYRYNGYVAPIFDTASYYRSNMQLLDLKIADEVFPEDRQIKTKPHDNPPAAYRHGARVRNAIISGGCRLAGNVTSSILGRNVVVESGATIANSIVLQSCVVQSGARVENAIIDRNNVIPVGTELRGSTEEILVKPKAK